MGLSHSKKSVEDELLFLEKYPNFKKTLSFDFKCYDQNQEKNINHEQSEQQIKENFKINEEQQINEDEQKDQLIINKQSFIIKEKIDEQLKQLNIDEEQQNKLNEQEIKQNAQNQEKQEKITHIDLNIQQQKENNDQMCHSMFEIKSIDYKDINIQKKLISCQDKENIMKSGQKPHQQQNILESHLDDLRTLNKDLFQSLILSEKELQKQMNSLKEKRSIYNISQYNPVTKQQEFKQLSYFEKDWITQDPHDSFVIEKKQVYQEKKENQVKNVINEFVKYSIGKVVSFQLPTNFFSITKQKQEPSYGRMSIEGLTIKQRYRKSQISSNNSNSNSNTRKSSVASMKENNIIQKTDQQQLEKIDENQEQQLSTNQQQSQLNQPVEQLIQHTDEIKQQTQQIQENQHQEQAHQAVVVENQQQLQQNHCEQKQVQEQEQILENLKESVSSNEEEQIQLQDYLINMGSQLALDLYAQTNKDLYDFEEIQNEQQCEHKLKVYLKSYTQDKFKINIFRSNFIVPCSAKFFIDFLNNEEEQKLLDNNMSEFYSIEKFHENYKLIYLAYKKVLIISARDFVYLKHFEEVKKEHLTEKDAQQYKNIWIDTSKSIIHEKFEPLKGKVRGEIIMSGYTIKEFEENDKIFSQVFGYSEINFKMNIPVAMTKSISKKEMKSYIEKSIERIKQLSAYSNQ